MGDASMDALERELERAISHIKKVKEMVSRQVALIEMFGRADHAAPMQNLRMILNKLEHLEAHGQALRFEMTMGRVRPETGSPHSAGGILAIVALETPSRRPR